MCPLRGAKVLVGYPSSDLSWFLMFSSGDIFVPWTDLHKLRTKAKDQFVFFFSRACSLAKFEETCSLTFLKHSSNWKLCRGIISMPTHFRYQPLQRHWANGQLERSSTLCRSPLEEYIPRVPFFSFPLLSLYWRSTQGQQSWLLDCESQDQFVIYQREQVSFIHWHGKPGQVGVAHPRPVCSICGCRTKIID